jgi:hypothetical protein
VLEFGNRKASYNCYSLLTVLEWHQWRKRAVPSNGCCLSLSEKVLPTLLTASCQEAQHWRYVTSQVGTPNREVSVWLRDRDTGKWGDQQWDPRYAFWEGRHCGKISVLTSVVWIWKVSSAHLCPSLLSSPYRKIMIWQMCKWLLCKIRLPLWSEFWVQFPVLPDFLSSGSGRGSTKPRVQLRSYLKEKGG